MSAIINILDFFTDFFTRVLLGYFSRGWGNSLPSASSTKASLNGLPPIRLAQFSDIPPVHVHNLFLPLSYSPSNRLVIKCMPSSLISSRPLQHFYSCNNLSFQKSQRTLVNQTKHIFQITVIIIVPP